MHLDPYILTFSAITVVATIWMGFWAARRSKTAHDFFVAGRSVSVGWNASAISGEYLSAASFMGIAGMVMSSGYDALWYPVCYACGYLFLLLFIAGPLRRFGAYTIPDFAEGRFDSPVFRKIAVIFVLFIGFFYTMPQMKGAGTTLAYIFPGLPYWAGVVLVGAVITLNVALGGMKGITLVQAFQYWAKMFAISVPIFVLMAVYGNYGKQLGLNGSANAAQQLHLPSNVQWQETTYSTRGKLPFWNEILMSWWEYKQRRWPKPASYSFPASLVTGCSIHGLLNQCMQVSGMHYVMPLEVAASSVQFGNATPLNGAQWVAAFEQALQQDKITMWKEGQRSDDYLVLIRAGARKTYVVPEAMALQMTNSVAAAAGAQILTKAGEALSFTKVYPPPGTLTDLQNRAREFKSKITGGWPLATGFAYDASQVTNGMAPISVFNLLSDYGVTTHQPIWIAGLLGSSNVSVPFDKTFPDKERVQLILEILRSNKVVLASSDVGLRAVPAEYAQPSASSARQPLPAKAPPDPTWLMPFGPLTTKAAKAASAALASQTNRSGLPLRPELSPDRKLTISVGAMNVSQALMIYGELTGRLLLPEQPRFSQRLDRLFEGRLSRWHLVAPPPNLSASVLYHADGATSAGELREALQTMFQTNGLAVVADGKRYLRAVKLGDATPAALQKEWLASHERPLALIYTYSLIIALVCGTAGLPHILVRFYTNPDGAAAKRTTMWVMILIGIFYLFPPIFGVLGRNLLPELYGGAGAKGTDKIVLELPRLLNERHAPLGSVLSGITCAGAFAAFMSTFSGLLVSMTGALAHDVYGRMLRPASTPEQRMRAFKISAVVVGAVAILLGMQVEQFQINFMVGQAFAIAAASYFPLLFMSAWWRGMTMKGAAIGMLAGGLLALTGITLTSFSDLKWLPLDSFWAAHPLARILCEQPAIWAVPVAIGLMIVVSKLTRREVPADIRMKMLVLHAPEGLGLKGEYVRS
jgi:Na+(H+)/acetate symporter ActP